MVEEKLVLALERIWKEVLTGSPQDLDALVSQHIEPLAQRLDIILAQLR